MKLTVVITSTRPGRVGAPVADWFQQAARDEGSFEVELADLAEIALPMLDEPAHPRRRDYRHATTRRWSGIVERSDAFVFVLPEYNATAPHAFVNAVNHLYHEWLYKPAGFVSYGGISGGMRAVQTAKPMLTMLKVMPVPEQVVIPMVASHLEGGSFAPTDIHRDAAAAMLAELAKWAGALRPLRG